MRPAGGSSAVPSARVVLRESIERFLTVAASFYAPATLVGHREKLCKLMMFCESIGLSETSAITRATLEAYYAWLCQTYRWGSVARHKALHSARRYLLWAYGAGETLLDFKDFALPPRSSPPPVVLSAAVMRRLLSLPDPDTAVGQRDQAILELLYVLGLRRGECAGIDLNDLDLGQATVKVTGKGGHQRLLPVSPGLLATLERYIGDGRQKLSRGDEKALLLSYKGGRRLTSGSLHARVAAYGRRLGLEIRPHLFRHACATHLVERGMDLRLVARLLGHESFESSHRYARVSARELERCFRRCHPRALLSNQR